MVEREGLIAQLAAPEERKLTLVEAPAGWGKTTLLTQWNGSDRESRPFAWISLDRGDNDAVRFWDAVVAALRTLVPGVGEAALPALRARGMTASELALPLLINDLDAAGVALVLVLDDYHLIANRQIHEAVAFFVDNLPPQVHLVISTRSEPPLPLGRLRVEAAMVELRPADLRFSRDEATEFLNGSLALGLDAPDVGRLLARTEGWVAGLQLAALSLRGETDKHHFIEQFAGDDRQIVDYLVSEVLGRQPAGVRAFMLRTSVLDRLCGELCDAVTGGSGSAAMLELLERENLFLVPLDAKRVWYRYHHLFAELLRHELGRVEPELVPALNRRAFDWYRDSGDVSDAIHHAAAAGETGDAADLIARNWFAFANLGRLETVMEWLDSLPEKAIVEDARLCIARALTSYLLGRLDEVDRWLRYAEGSDFDGPLPDGTASSVESGIHTVRAAHRYFTGDVGGAIESARRVVEIETPGHAFLNNARGLLGASYFWSGDQVRAAETLGDVLRHGRPGIDTIAMLHALGCLAALQIESDNLTAAERLSDDGVRLAEEHGLSQHFAASLAFTVRGRVLLAKDDGAGAEEAIRKGIELAARGAGRLFTAYGLLALTEALRAARDADGVAAASREASATIAACPDPGRLRGMFEQAAASRRFQRAPVSGDELSERELGILRLLATPMTQREIGGELFVSINTVKTHTRSIYRKLGATTRVEAVERAREQALI